MSDALEGRVLFSAFVVDTLEDTFVLDDSVVSLREAVQLANANPGDDRITFADDVRGTITLILGQLEVTDTSGSLTIDGPAAAALSVSGNNASRVFQIGGGGSANITGLTITAGNADVGAGIYSVGATLAVTQCAFLDNHATGAVGSGGGMYAKSGAVSVVECTFSGNTADRYGGGIDAEYAWPMTTTVQVSGCTFLSNAADQGGGIARIASMTVINTEFLSNRAARFGGAIFGGGDIVGSKFTDNTAGQAGGALYQYSGTTSITGSTFESNSTAIVMGDAGPATITDCTFRSNAGATSFWETPVTIRGCTFDSNVGHAFIASECTRIRIEATTFVNNRAAAGAAMSLSRSKATLENVSFIGNQAIGGNGGAIWMTSSDVLTISNCRFESNRAQGRNGTLGASGQSAEGGAISIDYESSSPVITGTTFFDNTVRGGDGGGAGADGNGGNGGDASGGAIANRGYRTYLVSACTFINNRAIAGKGGDAGAGATAGNGGNASGGALFGFPYYDTSSGTLSGSTIAANAAIGGNGGNAPDGGRAGNGGSASGGGFAAAPFAGRGSMSRCIVLANLARGGTGGTASAGGTPGAGGNALGGGLYSPVRRGFGIPAVFSISSSQITRNRAIGGSGAPNGLGQGGGIYSAEQTIDHPATRVTGNYASSGFDDLFGPVVRKRTDALLRSLTVRQG